MAKSKLTMGQIFDRISRIFKTGFSESDSGSLVNEENDELKKIIDSLHREYEDSRKNQSKENNFGKSKSGNENTYQNPINNSHSDAYRILGLEPSADIETIKHAHKEKMLIYHPDKLYGKSKEELEIAIENAKKINSAYQTIKQQRNF